jgi:hypothetical protein
VVVEPVVGATGGAILPAPGCHQRLREIRDRHGGRRLPLRVVDCAGQSLGPVEALTTLAVKRIIGRANRPLLI